MVGIRRKIINNKLRCSNCRRFLPLKEFRRNFSRKNSYQSFCKRCERFMNAKRRKKMGGSSMKEFGKWIVNQKPECIYCGITLSELNKAKHTHIFFGNCSVLTIDRKDNNKGYHIDNIVIACMRCNRIKSNIFTFEEMKIIGEMLRKKRTP